MPGIDQRELARLSRRIALELREALANVRDTSLRRQIDVWRHGFVARQGLLFDFERFGFDPYVSEIERKRRLHRLNRDGGLLADKLLSFLFFREIGVPTPRVYGFVEGSRFAPLHPEDGRDGLEGLLRACGKLVVKPRDGAHGIGFGLLEHVDGRALVNGEPVEDLESRLAGRMLVSEFVEQHDYARAIFPEATNTLRLLSLRRHDTGQPFVAAAIHRFGTDRSKPVDNTGKGGLSASIDLETGMIGPMAAMPGSYLPPASRVVWHDVHPETGAPVRGTIVPHWTEIVAAVDRTMASMSGFNWVGWDVCVTKDGFSMIEGNTGPDIRFQVHKPLMLDERARAVLEARGVVTR